MFLLRNVGSQRYQRENCLSWRRQAVANFSIEQEGKRTNELNKKLLLAMRGQERSNAPTFLIDIPSLFSQGKKCRFWKIFVEALEEFPNLFIQSETSASSHDHSERNHVMLLSNCGDEHRGLGPVSDINWYLFPRLDPRQLCSQPRFQALSPFGKGERAWNRGCSAVCSAVTWRGAPLHTVHLVIAFP